MSGSGSAARGVRVLEERIASLPAAILAAAAAPLPSLVFPESVRCCWTTGVGSSAAHARFLACVLEEAGLPSRFVPLGRFADATPRERLDTLLVVFSQGWSPTARIALAEPERFGGVVLVTSVAEGASPAAKVEAMRELEARGVAIVRTPGAEEYEILVRVIGPMTGYVAALRLAQAIAPSGPAIAFSAERAAEAVATAPARLAREGPPLAPAVFDEEIAFLAQGAYVECVDNLRAKVLEGMMRPLPPAFELLELAHGPLQRAHAGRATFLAFTRGDAPLERELLARFERCLDPDRHRVLRLAARASGLDAIFEHEAMLNDVLLRYVRERGVDQVEWPGRGRDAPLYEWRPSGAVQRETSPPEAGLVADPHAFAVAPALVARSLDCATWPELDAWIAAGARTAVLGLGSTEQHGHHLPFATDTWIAAALARRFCERVSASIALPALPIGCAREHLDFPGTLSLDEATLEAVLFDVVRSVSRAGFARMLVFSAHGGNEALLSRVGPALAAAGAPMQVVVHADLARTTARLHDLAAAGHGVDAAAAGHHAGAVETSMLLHLAPETVRRDRLAPGRVEVPDDVSSLFYPSLRANAPEGTVGDPRGASARAGAAYLESWTDELVAAYEAATDASEPRR